MSSIQSSSRWQRCAAMFAVAIVVSGTAIMTGCGGNAPTAVTGSQTSPTPRLTTTSLPAASVNLAYSTKLTATSGTLPYTFAIDAGTLPPGLMLSADGTLAGTPTTAGTYSFTASVTDSKKLRASAVFSLTVSPAPSITSTALASGEVGAAYSQQLAATSGTTPYTFAVVSGTLPAGLSLSSGGVLSGTPTTAGSYTFMASVTDASRLSSTAAVTVAIIAGPAIDTTTLAATEVGASYSQQLAVSAGTAPYTLALASGTLPPGVALSASGALSGAPTSQGTYSFKVVATDARSVQVTSTLSIRVAQGPTITTTSLPAVQVGSAFSQQIVASNGSAPYLFNVSAGALPTGLTLSSGGLLSGTAGNTAGAYAFTVAATDALGVVAMQAYTLTLTPSGSTISVTGTTLANALVGSAYTATLGISGGTAPYTLTPSGTLPAGITVSNAGVISGTPTVGGVYTFTLAIADSATTPHTLSVPLTLTVAVGAKVAVNAATTLATVPATGYGVHTSVYDPLLSDTSALPALLSTAGTAVLRYPGGSYSDAFHWAQYSSTPFYSSDANTCGVLFNPYLAPNADFGHFVATLAATGTQGLVTVNYGTSVADAKASIVTGMDGQQTCSQPGLAGQPQEAAAWVAYANGDPSSTQVIGVDAVGFDWKTVGYWASLRAASPLGTDDGQNFLRIGHAAPVGIRNWEIGNEMYYNGWAGNGTSETDLHAPYVYDNGYQNAFESRTGVTSLGPVAYGANAALFLKAMKAVDPTIQIGVDFSYNGVDSVTTAWNNNVMQTICAQSSFDLAIVHYYPGTYNDVQTAQMLADPQADLPRLLPAIGSQLLTNCPAIASKVKVFVTEAGENGTVDASVPAQVPALYLLNIYLSGLQAGIQNVDWLELHDGAGRLLDGAEQPQPAFYGAQLAHQAAAVGDTFVQSSSDTAAITSYAVTKANGQKAIVLVNADPSAPATVTVTWTGATVGSSAMQYSYGVGTTPGGTQLQGTAVAVGGNSFPVTVPPYTAVEWVIQ